MDAQVLKTVEVSMEDLLETMTPEEMGDFICLVSERFNKNLPEWSKVAGEFADALSENALQFMAQTVVSHYSRNK